MEDNTRIDLFNSEFLVDIIANRMDTIDELKNRIPKESEQKKLEFVDKSFFKRVLNDITDIEVSSYALNVYFDRGVSLHIDSATENIDSYNRNIGDIDYRALKIIGELIDLGELHIRTSPFTIKMTKDELKAVYHSSLDQDLYSISHAMNIHDNGINCWGGWGGPIRSNYDQLNLENSLILILQRMQQLNIDDFARSTSRMSELIKSAYKNQPIEINPIILARLVIEYDLQNRVLRDDLFDYFSRGHDDKLEILEEVRTNIDYSVFVDLIRNLNNEYEGERKTKISLRRSGE